MIVATHKSKRVLAALKDAHPYEEVSYFITEITNENQGVGSGIVGDLPIEMDTAEFFNKIKSEFSLEVIKHTSLCKDKVKRVAFCGGSGSFLLKNAKRANADVFITSDFKYHEYFDAENEIIIMDIGHYESEIHTKELFYDSLSKKFTNIAVNLSSISTNPVNYYY